MTASNLPVVPLLYLKGLIALTISDSFYIKTVCVSPKCARILTMSVVLSQIIAIRTLCAAWWRV